MKKYILSILVFLLAYFNYKSFKVPFVLLIIIYLFPNYLVYSYIKKEKNILINELRNILLEEIIDKEQRVLIEKTVKLLQREKKQLKEVYKCLKKMIYYYY